MMATTHGFAGLALVAPVAYAVPELATPLAVGAICGAIFPDLDVAFEHRRTLHFPLLYGFVAVPAVLAAAIAPGAVTAAVAAFAVAAWLHAASDALGAGPELDPWRRSSDRAVYDHLRGRWLRPRRWIRYDGAPEDAMLAVGLAIPALVVFDDVGWVTAAVAVGLVVSIGYTLVRRRLVDWVEAIG